MIVDLHKKPLAELLSLFRQSTNKLKNEIIDRIQLLEEEKEQYASIFEDNTEKVWEISVCITWLTRVVELLNDRNFATFIRKRKKVK